MNKKNKILLTKSRAIQPATRPLASTSQLGPEKNTKTLSKNVFESLLSQDKDKTNAEQSNVNIGGGGDDDEDDDNDYEEYDDSDVDLEDEGSIHPFGPHIDPKKLLNTLTNTNTNYNFNNNNDEISHFSQSPFPTVTRKSNIDVDGKKHDEAPLPGPPRDLVAQIVNPRFVALSWMEPLKNPDEVISYTVYYKMTTSER